jgi:hypothetical protein
MKGAKPVWRYADRLYGTQLLNHAEQPESDNYRGLVEAYSPLPQTRRDKWD